MCINVALALIFPTPLLKPREYWLIGWADHLNLASTNHSMTFENAGSSEKGRFFFSFLRIAITLTIFHAVCSFPSVNDRLMSPRKRCLVVVASDALLIIE